MKKIAKNAVCDSNANIRTTFFDFYSPLVCRITQKQQKKSCKKNQGLLHQPKIVIIARLASFFRLSLQKCYSSIMHMHLISKSSELFPLWTQFTVTLTNCFFSKRWNEIMMKILIKKILLFMKKTYTFVAFWFLVCIMKWKYCIE